MGITRTVSDPLWSNVAFCMDFTRGLEDLKGKQWMAGPHALVASGEGWTRDDRNSVFLADNILDEEIGTGSYCLEVTASTDKSDGIRVIIDFRMPSQEGNYLDVYLDSGGRPVLFLNGGGRITSSASVSAGEVFNVAIAKDAANNIVRMFLNGSLVGSTSDSRNYVGRNVTLMGSRFNTNAWQLNGRCMMAKLTVGHPRYTESYTPSSQFLVSPYTVTVGGSVSTLAAPNYPRRIEVREWDTGRLLGQVEPNSPGEWSVSFPGDIGDQFLVSYIADDCVPTTHGPYMVE